MFTETNHLNMRPLGSPILPILLIIISLLMPQLLLAFPIMASDQVQSSPAANSDPALCAITIDNTVWDRYEIAFNDEHNKKETFLILDAPSGNKRLYLTKDGASFKDVTPAGSWADINHSQSESTTGNTHYFEMETESGNQRLFTTDDGETFTDITPAGAWNRISFKHSTSEIVDFFIFEDSSNNQHLLSTSDGINLTNLTPTGTWQNIQHHDPILILDGFDIFGMNDSSLNPHLFLFKNGEPLIDVTPPGAWRGFVIATESRGDSLYFAWLRNDLHRFILHSVDNNGQLHPGPNEEWTFIDSLTLKHNTERSYFLFEDGPEKVFASTVDGVSYVEGPRGEWVDVHKIGEGSATGGFDFFAFETPDNSLHLYAFKDGVATKAGPAGPWLNIIHMARAGGRDYFQFRGNPDSIAFIYSIDDNLNPLLGPIVNPANIKSLNADADFDDALFFIKDASGHGDIFVTLDGSDYVKLPHDGNWSDITFMAQRNEKYYYRIFDSDTGTYSLNVTQDGRTFTNISPTGDWSDILNAPAEGEETPIFFTFVDTATSSHHLFAFSPNDQAHEAPSTEEWQAISIRPKLFEGRLLIQFFGDETSYLYSTTDGITYTQANGLEDGWDKYRIVTSEDGIGFFVVEKNDDNDLLYSTSDGLEFTNLTPVGTWKDIQTVHRYSRNTGIPAESRHFGFTFLDGADFGFVFLSLDGNTLSAGPVGPWKLPINFRGVRYGRDFYILENKDGGLDNLYGTCQPEINLFGNNTLIDSGDRTPSPADGTEFGEAEATIGTVTHTFTISNTGNSGYPLTLDSIAPVQLSGGTNFSVTQPEKLVLEAGESTTFEVVFRPSRIAAMTDTITILSDDFDEPITTFVVSGTGIAGQTTLTPAPSPTLTATPTATPGPSTTPEPSTGNQSIFLPVIVAKP
ncbi:MAG: choice-of-anchor D domain-containing protein [Anaerolineae bacterium]